MEAVDEYVLGEGFVVPPEGVPVASRPRFWRCQRRGAAPTAECSVYITGHGVRV